MIQERSLLFLMANLGSEVSRLLSWKAKGNSLQIEKCKARSEKIINDIRQLHDIKERLGEVDILSMVISDIASISPTLRVTPKELNDYFSPFALRMMKSVETPK